MTKNLPFKKAAALFFLLLFVSLSSFATKHMIMVANISFSPNNITNVTVGDTIQWMWSSGTHNTTSGIIPNGAATWASPITSSSQIFEYKVTVAGNYGYSCTLHGGMVGGFVATAASGISSLTANMIFSFYPNPATDKSVLLVGSPAAYSGKIVITDMLGKTVAEESVVISAGENRFSLPAASLRKGIYFVTLLIEAKQVSVTRLVKE
jgi:plastocyanin